MIAMLSAVAGLLVIGLIVLVAVLDRLKLPRWQRWGLCLTGAGLVGAAPGRFLAHPPGVFDLMMLVGLLVYLAALYGPALRR